MRVNSSVFLQFRENALDETASSDEDEPAKIKRMPWRRWRFRAPRVRIHVPRVRIRLPHVRIPIVRKFCKYGKYFVKGAGKYKQRNWKIKQESYQTSWLSAQFMLFSTSHLNFSHLSITSVFWNVFFILNRLEMLSPSPLWRRRYLHCSLVYSLSINKFRVVMHGSLPKLH